MRFVIVIAPDRDWFNTWCLIENDPPLNPRDPRWVVVTKAEDTRKLYGLQRELTDIQVLERPYSGWNYIYEVLVSLRFWHPKQGPINIWNPSPAEFASFWSKSP